MKKSFLTLGIVLMLTQVSLAQEQQVEKRDLSNKEMQKQNKEIVKLASEEISKTLPQTVDKYTVLKIVEGKDTTLVYTFEINTGAKSDATVQKEDHSRMKQAVTTGICHSAKRFIDAQIDITYIYIAAKSKTELFRFEVTQADCFAAEKQKN